VAGGDSNYPQVFNHTVQPLLAQQPAWWPDAHRSLKAFQYAAGMVQSRSFHINQVNWVTQEHSEHDDLYMLAGIDMVNHAVHGAQRNATLELLRPHAASAAATPTPGRAAASQAGTFVLKAERDIAAGEEVCISYGDLSDAQLLRIYGFVAASPTTGASPAVLAAGSSAVQASDNPHNSVSLPTELLVDAFLLLATESGATSAAVKQEAVELWESRVRLVLPVAHLTAGDPLPPPLLSAALVMLMEEEEYRDYVAPADGDPSDDTGAGSSSGGRGAATPGGTVFPLQLPLPQLAANLPDDNGEMLSNLCNLLLMALQALQQRKKASMQKAAQQQTEGANGHRLAAARQVVAGEMALLRSAMVELLAAQNAADSDSEESHPSELEDAQSVDDDGQLSDGCSDDAGPASKRQCS